MPPMPYLRLKEAILILTGPKGFAELLLKGVELFRRNLSVNGQVASVNDIFIRALQIDNTKTELDAKLEKDPNLTIANIGQDLSELNVLAQTTDGVLTVGGIAYHAEVLRPSLTESPVTRRYAYHDPLSGADLAWCAMADLQLHGLGDYGMNDTLYHFCIWRFPIGESDSIGGAFFPE